MTSHVHQGKIFPSQSGHLVFPRYRADIDGLRGVAVLSVVGFHAFPAWVKGGFIGVDIFFVISGFLISTIIFKSLERNSFSFVEFYSRRIRRIFPALLVVLVACYLFGWFALLAGEYKQLGKHIAASAGFVSNFVLWNESGYFDPASETKPLLHLWSLGIEEQFYIVWPLLLWVAWKKRFNFLAITIAAGIISFALNLTNYRSDGVANFYSPQTRFWELFVGSLLAYIAHHNIQFMGRYWVELDRLLGKVVWAQAPIGALLIATSLMVITKGQPFPGTWATLPVLGAVLIIGAGADAWVNRIILSNRVLVWIGLISFPIYLWHWPLLSFARIIESGVPDRSIRAASVVVSIILAWLTYKLVEHHFRFGNRSKAHIYFLAVSMIFFGSVGYFTYEQNGLPFGRSIPDLDGVYSQIVWTNDDRSDVACQKHFGKTYSYCKLASDKVPTVALIGDSFANSYFLGLSIEYNKVGDNLVMLGAGGCPPLLNITSGFVGQLDWCNSMSSDAIKHVANLSNIHTVILAANWHLYINGTRFHQTYDRLWAIGIIGENERHNAFVFSTQIKKTVDFLNESGKRIIIMKQIPELNFNPVRCLASRPFASGKSVEKCEVPSELVRSYAAEYESIFDPIFRNDPRVHVLDPLAVICPDKACKVLDGEYPIYRDELHLSPHGSKYLASRLKLF